MIRNFGAPVVLVGALVLAGCGETGMPSPELDPDVVAARALVGPVPEELKRGEAGYMRDCAKCHGEDALGNLSGPPLLHAVYAPMQHSDAAFLLSVRAGMKAHHFNFGDMERMPAVTAEMVGEITSYIRWLQREVGVF